MLIKRPLVISDQRVLVGFNEKEYEKAMKDLQLEQDKLEHNISELPGKEETIWF